MRLQNIMRTDVVTIDAAKTATVAWTRMRQQRIRHLVVTDNGRLVGLVSERDLGGRAGDANREGRAVRDLMSSRLVYADPKMTLRQAANLMRGRLVGCLPVMDGDQLVGIVTATDVLDELGRGFTRPAVRARRHPLRSPPPSRTQRGSKSVVVRGPHAARRVGRARHREPDSEMRSALADRLPRSSKSRRGRTGTSQVPAFIRAGPGDLAANDRAYIRRKLGMKLGKFATSIERVSVRVDDANGPRGGIDQVCRIKATLSGAPSVIHESRDANLHAAIDLAMTGIERVVRRALGRQRTKSLKAAA
ncbi:MAG: CBS domain-containing protein [Phycisphaerales bacterium]|nr:CBS domain-containing protein [Phycisphaerales bacterium]